MGVQPGLPVTGERTVPDLPEENYWFRRHEVVYRWVADRLPAGARVLDAGCGEGYGAAVLAPGRAVLALDYDRLSLSHVRRRYGVPAVRGNLVGLPVADRSLDAVVSLQAVEHLWDQPAYVTGLARVLRSGGAAYVSTPNRLTFSPDGVTRNVFHTTELSADELEALLRRAFAEVTVYGVHHGPRLRTLDDRLPGGLVEAQLAAPPDRWDPALGAAVAAVTCEDFDLRADDLDASLDLVAVAAGPAR